VGFLARYGLKQESSIYLSIYLLLLLLLTAEQKPSSFELGKSGWKRMKGYSGSGVRQERGGAGQNPETKQMGPLFGPFLAS
jgi:hypothetical protein